MRYFRFSKSDDAALDLLAASLGKNQTDALRHALRLAVEAKKAELEAMIAK